jgi:glycosyltransferase involved in cell wall biosynthesis
MLKKPWNPLPDIIFEHRTTRIYDMDDHVSVIVTNYNYENYVIECLNSIAAQTHYAISIVVVDDDSSDNSVEVILEWLEGNKSRFISASLLRNMTNQGPSSSRNTAIEYCLAETIFIIDADNKLMPSAISKLRACLGRSGAQAVYSQLVEFGTRSQIGAADLWDVQRMYKGNYVDVMAMMKKSAWEAVGGFSHIEEGWEDYDFWLKFIDKGIDVVFLPEILCSYRVHGASRTAMEAHKSHHELEVIMRYRHPNKPDDLRISRQSRAVADPP